MSRPLACPSCGYDLRGRQTMTRRLGCPECGADHAVFLERIEPRTAAGRIGSILIGLGCFVVGALACFGLLAAVVVASHLL